jgi:hypothetical protein
LEKGEVAGEVKLAAVCLRVSFRFFFFLFFSLVDSKKAGRLVFMVDPVRFGQTEVVGEQGPLGTGSNRFGDQPA